MEYTISSVISPLTWEDGYSGVASHPMTDLEKNLYQTWQPRNLSAILFAHQQDKKAQLTGKQLIPMHRTKWVKMSFTM